MFNVAERLLWRRIWPARRQNGLNRRLALAIIHCNLEEVEFLLEQGADVNAFPVQEIVTPQRPIYADRAPLHVAVSRGDQDGLLFVMFLLEKGANVNMTTPTDGLIPLHLAVCNGSLAIVRMLLEYGADPLKQDREGRSSIDLAMATKRTDILSLLGNYVATSA